MLSFQTVLPDTLELLNVLMQEPLLANTRLVGGTALALQYGHRRSVDLDFFGQVDDTDAIRESLKKVGTLNVIKESKHILIYILNNIKIDIVDYSTYPWLKEPIAEEGLRLASPQDIAAMKINAIEGRGSRKDFIDIYFLLQHYSLNQILQFYQRKYPENSVFRALMSLTYFDDAEQQDMPTMFSDKTWTEMKQYIVNHVKNI